MRSTSIVYKLNLGPLANQTVVRWKVECFFYNLVIKTSEHRDARGCSHGFLALEDLILNLFLPSTQLLPPPVDGFLVFMLTEPDW